MSTYGITHLRAALQAVLESGKSQSEDAINLRHHAQTVLAHSYPLAVEDAVIAAANERAARANGDVMTTFSAALEHFGTSLIAEVLQVAPSLLSEDAAPIQNGAASQLNVETLQLALATERSVSKAFRGALERIAEGGPAEEPEPEDYDDTESAYNNGEDVGSWTQAAIARATLAAFTDAVVVVGAELVDMAKFTNLPAGTVLMTFSGEISDVGDLGEVSTEPLARGYIDRVFPNQESCYSVVFPASGVSVFLSPADIADNEMVQEPLADGEFCGLTESKNGFVSALVWDAKNLKAVDTGLHPENVASSLTTLSARVSEWLKLTTDDQVKRDAPRG